MSNYTTQLRFICESYAGEIEPTEQSHVEAVISIARPKIFDFEYPIFSSDYKSHLEEKIISHYYTHEIGVESVGLWKLRLRNKMREIMPYYNQLYQSELLEYNPFINVDVKDGNETNTRDIATGDITRKDTTDTDGTKSSDRDMDSYGVGDSETNTEDTTTVTGVGTSTEHTEHAPVQTVSTLVKHSDTPLGSVNGVTSVGDNSNYLSDVTQTIVEQGGNGVEISDTNGHTTNESTTRNIGNSTTHTTYSDHTDDKYNEITHTGTEYNSKTDTSDESTGNRKYDGWRYGKDGTETYQEMLLKHRETFLNIDMDIINELSDLFMMIY